MSRWKGHLKRSEWIRLAAFMGAVVVLHLLGWGLFLYYARRSPALAGLGTLAYTFGLRHAFDADHIAGFRDYGAYIGTSVSGTFLLLIGVLNLIVLLDILGVFRRMREGSYDAQELDEALMTRGLMSRMFLRRLGDRIDASWKMYPLGALFGLGFDTATEIGLLAIAAGVATHHVPFLAVISLPLIFAAGMSLMDTADGAFMSHAYGWAFSNPIRKVYYNITVTSLSVLVALVIGTIELLQVVAMKLTLQGGFWMTIRDLDFGRLGYVVVGLFVVTWVCSVAIWKARRIEQRWAVLMERARN